MTHVPAVWLTVTAAKQKAATGENTQQPLVGQCPQSGSGLPPMSSGFDAAGGKIGLNPIRKLQFSNPGCDVYTQTTGL